MNLRESIVSLNKKFKKAYARQKVIYTLWAREAKLREIALRAERIYRSKPSFETEAYAAHAWKRVNDAHDERLQVEAFKACENDLTAENRKRLQVQLLKMRL